MLNQLLYHPLKSGKVSCHPTDSRKTQQIETNKVVKDFSQDIGKFLSKEFERFDK